MRNTAASVTRRWHIPLQRLGIGLFTLILAWFVVRLFGLRLAVFLAALVVTILGVVLIFFRSDGALVLRRGFLPLLTVAILFPCIRLPAGIPDVRPEFIIVLVAWGLLLLGHFATGRPIRLRRFPAYKWFLLFDLCILVSMTYAALVKGQPVIWRDFWELVKPILYLLTFALVANLRISAPSMKQYYKFSLIILLLSTLFGFAQYIDLAGINTVISPYYAPTQMQGLLVHGRITGTTSNPNQFGALMVLATSLALSGGLFLKEKSLRILSLGTLPFFGLALILTMSRTALVCAVVVTIVVIVKFLKQRDLKKKFRRVLWLVLFACIGGLVILPIIPETAFFRYFELAHFTEASSYLIRIKAWKDHLNIWECSPLLGWGPGKTIISTNVDNEWLLLLVRYGLVGLIVFLILTLSLYRSLSRIQHTPGREETRAMAVALQATFVGYVTFMIFAGVYHDLQLMPICMMLIGLVCTQTKEGVEQ